ncbi:tetratricopeptide repeat protein [Streptomyces sp. MST-110588]|uniref:tetratricopeptide repeat protein n=1 Tax=Streptomyces sp. MST-110588 TaxID=2833628 RepID=UPI001F5C6ABE|nr:tetratricopeptide repeat protein [Streptomyces sp. MST-110588]UNO43137.1 hypothetical protein KGS77_31130 [Streptomyces sp. MST-110588]
MSEPATTCNSIGGGARVETAIMTGVVHHLTVNQFQGEAAAYIPAAVPRQALPPTESFTNRGPERRTVVRGTEAGPRRHRPLVINISGAGGIGKTELGRMCAHDLGPRYPDGTLCVEFGRWRRDGLVEIGDVLAYLLEGLGVDRRVIPATAAGRAALYTSRTAGRRLLLVLDDAREADDLTSLMPASAQSVVLVLSHHRLTELFDEAVIPVPLGPLGPEHSRHLLSALVSEDRMAREPEAAAELVRLCAGMPGALRAAGRRLRERPHRPVSLLVDELREAANRLDGFASRGRNVMEALWDGVYEELPPTAARLYRLLAGHPGPDCTVASAAALLGPDAGDAEEALEELVRAGLLECARSASRSHSGSPSRSQGSSSRSLDDRVRDRYFFLELLRLHAERRAAEDGPDDGPGDGPGDGTGDGAQDGPAAGWLRVARWYGRQAARAERVIKPDRLRIAALPPVHAAPGPDLDFRGAAAATDWLERERHALFDCAERAAQDGQVDLACSLAESLDILFESHRHYDDSARVLRAVIEAVVRSGHRDAEAWMRCLYARVLWELERYDRAAEQIEGAFAAVRGSANRRLEAAVWERAGKLHRERGEPDRAEEHFRRALALNEEIGNRRGEMIQLYLIAGLRTRSGAAAEAVVLLDRAAAIARGESTGTDDAGRDGAGRDGTGTPPDERMQGRIAHAAGLARLALGEREAARECLRTALEVALRRGADFDEALTREALAELARDPAEAAEHRARARQIYAAAAGMVVPDQGQGGPGGTGEAGGTSAGAGGNAGSGG